MVRVALEIKILVSNFLHSTPIKLSFEWLSNRATARAQQQDKYPMDDKNFQKMEINIGNLSLAQEKCNMAGKG